MAKRQQSLEDFINQRNLGEQQGHTVNLLAELEEGCKSCTLCSLRSGCMQVVFGDGNPRARLMLVGEGPGAEEDRQGKPFVGAAGQLLDRILAAINLSRQRVYIANIVKCRPPGNRAPSNEEIIKCLPYLKQQIELIDPLIIVTLGAVATRVLLDPGASITRIRGNWVQHNGRFWMPTFHPAALLRDPGKKKPVWEDFKQVKQKYDQTVDEVEG